MQSILLATDFRPASQDAVNAANRLASAFGSRVTLLHALEALPAWAMKFHREYATEALSVIARRLACQDVRVGESCIVEGPAVATIVRKALHIDADLILIGAGEQSRFQRFSVGPVAASVLEHALTPVLAIRTGEPPARFQKILCPVDHSGASRRGLRNAIRLARALAGEIVVLTVVPDVSWLSAAVETGHLAGGKAEHEKAWRHDFEKFLSGISFDDVKLTKEIRSGVPHQQIIQAARYHCTDLIVMGATGRSGLVRLLLGSVTRRVLQDLPCSLLTVKEEELVEEAFEGDLRFLDLLTAQGRELLHAGAHEAALSKFRRVLAHNPFHLPALKGLAETLEKLGRHDQALYYRRRVEDMTTNLGKEAIC
jgi:nucleotide-binding universal stress UspA family protein